MVTHCGTHSGTRLVGTRLENPMDRGAWQRLQSMGLERVGQNRAQHSKNVYTLFHAAKLLSHFSCV